MEIETFRNKSFSPKKTKNDAFKDFEGKFVTVYLRDGEWLQGILHTDGDRHAIKLVNKDIEYVIQRACISYIKHKKERIEECKKEKVTISL